MDIVAGRARVCDWIQRCEFPDTSDRDIRDKVYAAVVGAKIMGQQPVVIFDLDATIYTTAPRAWAALKHVLATRGNLLTAQMREKIAGLTDYHWYSVAEAFDDLGISMLDQENGETWARASTYWFEKYRSPEAVALDELYGGAGDYVRKIHAAGATVVYLTGRQKALMEASTIANLRRDGLPLGDDVHAYLFTKPTGIVDDIEFKRLSTTAIGAMGKVVGTFDNEPGNVVVFADAFPQAINVFVDTNWSHKAQPPRKGLWRMRHWH